MRRWIVIALMAAIPAVAGAQSESAVPSPDGRRIAFVSKRDGTSEIYVVSSSGDDVKRLTNLPGDKSEWVRGIDGSVQVTR